MFPILLTIGPLKIYSFGVFLALAVIIGSFIIWREGRNKKFDEEKLLNLLLYVGIFGLVGARIYYLVWHFEDFGLNPFYWLLLFHFPGLSFIGAILGGILGLWIFSKKEKWPFWEIGDIWVLGVSFGEAIGRIGAFLSGSAYGVPTTLPWGVPMVGLLGKRHPVQIYEGLVALLTFIILVKLKKLPPGLIFLLYFLVFGLSRFFLEFLRGDSVYFFRWRVIQLVCLVFIIFSGILIYRRLGRSIKRDIAGVFSKLRSVHLTKIGFNSKDIKN